MKLKDKIIYKFGGTIASLALALTVLGVNTPCRAWNYQPPMPKGAEKLKKIK